MQYWNRLAQSDTQFWNNDAFWVFCGVAVTAYFSYKGLLLPYIDQKKKAKYKNKNGNGKGGINVSRVTSFDELKSVVEILQSELERKDRTHVLEIERKDRAHAAEMKHAHKRIEELSDGYEALSKEVERLKERLRLANINHQ